MTFFKDIIDNGDIEALDVYFTYYYDQSSIGGMTRHKSEHDYYLKIFSEYNLKIKHSMDYKMDDSERDERKREEKIRSTLSEFIDLTDYRSLLTTEVKRQITEELLRNDIEKRIENLDNLEKEVLYFVLSYISLKTQEYFLALDEGSDYSDPYIRFVADSENKRNILYYDLTSDVDHHKKWKYIFNLLFDQRLIHGYAIPIYDERMNETIGILRISEKLYAYDLGNIIVKSGLGYWEPWVTGSQNLNVHLELIIPKFIYDLYDFDDFGNNNQDLPPKPPKPPKFQDFGNRVKEIEKRLTDEIAKEAHFRPPEEKITFPFRPGPNGTILPIRVKWIRF